MSALLISLNVIVTQYAQIPMEATPVAVWVAILAMGAHVKVN